MASTNFLSMFLVILLASSYVSCKWCSRLKAEKTVKTIFESAQCKQSYHTSCGWFTRAQCTFYEMVPCTKERNHTELQYKIVNECCPGYILDPINNITCIYVPGLVKAHDGSSVQYYVPEDGLIFGLSHGAYAGIICSLLFAGCVIVLIILHVLKRRRTNLRAKESNGLEIGVSEKMISQAKA
uniref:EMI domain-containing protein n=1 Tax=Arion vulgaris TaxID=1028688 RepID=A0A0B7A958_9EUPU